MSEKKFCELQKNREIPSQDTLVMSLLFLMSRYNRTPSTAVFQSIVEHLELLESHPTAASSPLGKTSSRLRHYWQLHLKDRNHVDPDSHREPVNQSKASLLH